MFKEYMQAGKHSLSRDRPRYSACSAA